MSHRAGVAVFLALMLSPATGAEPAGEDPLLEKSRAITEEFASRLKAALTDALAAGGPPAAIGVCKDLAPRIAAEMSRLNGARVVRTSLRLRNPINAPTAWEAKVLRQFDARSAGGEEPLEHFTRIRGGEARYMKAIRTGPLCLSCHGTALSEGVSAQLETEYPFDRARGYAAGEVRGAFSILWPAPYTL